METFIICFIPIFVAIDPLGIMPIFMTLTQNMSKKDRRRVLNQSVLTALLVSLLFLFAGHAIFRVLGIEMTDFQIAGGLVLLIIAVLDLIHPNKEERQPDSNVGVVPIGIPLIIGPAALTTLMVLSNHHSFWNVVAALLSNIVIVTGALFYAQGTKRIIGINGMKAFSKIISLFLAAIAVMFIRVGLQKILG